MFPRVYNKRCRRGSMLKGCLIALAVLIGLLIIAGIVVALKWRSWTASFTNMVTEKAVTSSQLPQDQKDRIIARVKGVTEEFKAGKITVAQFGDVGKAIAEGPLLPLGVAWGVREKYFEKSELSAEEKAGGTRSIERFARGVAEKSIPMSALQGVMDPIMDNPSANKHELKASVTDDELRAFLANAKAKADEVKIPDEAYHINIADELDKAIDSALGKSPKP
jgi:hypothetical protein